MTGEHRQRQVDNAVEKYVKSVVGGLLIVLPVLVLGALDAPEWAITSFLIAAVVVLGLVVIVNRRRARRP